MNFGMKGFNAVGISNIVSSLSMDVGSGGGIRLAHGENFDIFETETEPLKMQTDSTVELHKFLVSILTS